MFNQRNENENENENENVSILDVSRYICKIINNSSCGADLDSIDR